jgi:L-fuconolactonase
LDDFKRPHLQAKPIMIDAHQHFWKYNAREYDWITEALSPLKRDFLPHHLDVLLNEEQISGSICVQARQSEIENDFLLQQAAETPSIMGVVGWVDLRSERVGDRLEFYRNYPKMKGFRHVVQDEADLSFLLQPAFLNGIRCLIQAGFTYDILVYARQLPQVCAFLNHFPDTPFILDHLAKPDIKNRAFSSWQADMKKIAAFPKVMVKISGMITEADWQHWKKEDFYPYLDELVRSFGIDRLCYGSDWPVCTLAGTYQAQFDLITSYFNSFHVSDREKIMGLNSLDFYHINPF